MAEKKRVVVAGARGVFGSLLVRELAGYDVVATTRETLDLRDLEAVRNAAAGAFAFACAAGPFQLLDRRIVRAAVDAGAHWLDIADDARWFFDLIDDRELDAAAKARGVAVMPGLSTLPAVSYALVRRMRPVDRVAITLYIGNDNAKGAAAIASGSALDSPDRELLRREGIEAAARARFQLPGVSVILRGLALLPAEARMRVARVLARLAKPFRFGAHGGFVEVRSGDRIERIERTDQRLAILPLVYALEHLPPPGVHGPDVLDAEELLQFVSR
ncbi:MAG TPA: hypothetical protein VEK57_27785 [Thermoanaerobaculia bacterium]|nr:hypothetical protein [Thermoanaerobaculia bacterium]